jgi:hypothetical protein
MRPRSGSVYRPDTRCLVSCRISNALAGLSIAIKQMIADPLTDTYGAALIYLVTRLEYGQQK